MIPRFLRYGFRRNIWELSKISDPTGRMIGTRHFVYRPNAKREDFPILLYLTLRYENRPLPSKAEMDRFDAFTDAFDRILEREDLALIVGIMTIDGKRDWILYAKSRAVVDLYFRELGDWSIELEATDDPRWTQYRDLLSMR